MKNRLIRLLNKQLKSSSSSENSNENIKIIIKNAINSTTTTKTTISLIGGNQDLNNKLIKILNLNQNKYIIKPFQSSSSSTIIPAEALQAELIIINNNKLGPSILKRIHQPVIILPIDLEKADNAIHDYEHRGGGVEAIDQINQSGLIELKNQIKDKLADHTKNRLLATLSISELILSQSVDQLLLLTHQLQHASTRLTYYKSKFDRLKKMDNTRDLSTDSSSTVDLFDHLPRLFPFNTRSVGYHVWKIIQDSYLTKIEQNVSIY